MIKLKGRNNQNMTSRTRQLGQGDSWDRPTGQQEQDNLDRKTVAGQPGQDSWDMKARIGQPGQVSLYRSACTGLSVKVNLKI